MNYPNLEYWKLLTNGLEHISTRHGFAWTFIYNKFDPNACLFDSKFVPSITIKKYLKRFVEYSGCSKPCYIVAYIYIRRALEFNLGLMLSMQNIHKFILASILLAAKYIDERCRDNEIYAKIGGVSLEEINSLEVAMLNLLQYNLFVKTKLYKENLNELVTEYIKHTEHKKPILELKAEIDYEIQYSDPEHCIKPSGSSDSIKTNENSVNEEDAY